TTKTESECVTNECMYFDGVDDYINCGNNADLDFITYAGTYTFAAWIYSDNLVGVNRPTIVGKNISNSNRNALSYSNNAIRFGYYDGVNWFGVSGVFNAGKWIYAVGVNDEKSLSLYLNGIIQTDGGSPYIASSNSLTIGWSGNNSVGEYWKGLLDDVRIYSAALSSAQIKQQYIAGLDSLLAKGSISEEEYEQGLNNLAYEK
ncbi:MAG: LamG domain-containing protein, partial [Bacilli bacterium]|nr:LamG domain-containing protein [Bacilli bacterium]